MDAVTSDYVPVNAMPLVNASDGRPAHERRVEGVGQGRGEDLDQRASVRDRDEAVLELVLSSASQITEMLSDTGEKPSEAQAHPQTGGFVDEYA